VSHQKEAIEPSYPIQQDQDHANHPQVLLGHVSGPLTNSYQMELGPPLGIPVSNSLETSCSSPTEDSMVWTPSSSLRRGDKEAYNHKSKGAHRSSSRPERRLEGCPLKGKWPQHFL
jgi:hypothetical protein